VIFDTRRVDLPSMGNCCAFEPRRPKFGGKPKTAGPKQRVVLTFKQPMIQPAGLGSKLHLMGHTRSERN